MYIVKHFPMYFLIYFSITLANHIIFEQVGEMASSVTYIHVKMQVDFGDWHEHYEQYLNALSEINSAFKYNSKFFENSKGKIPGVRDLQDEMVLTHLRTIGNLTDSRKKIATRLLRTFQALKQTMPDTPDDGLARIYRDTSTRKDKIKEHVASISKSAASSVLSKAMTSTTTTMIRKPRGLISLGLGALGTFMGLYNTFQIKALQKELEQTQDAHNRLVEVVQFNELHLIKLNVTVRNIIHAITFIQAFDISTLATQLLDIELDLKDRLVQMTHTIQKAQDHRLAIDFLPASQLYNLFQKVKEQALAIDHKLLTNQPSDFFQLELSYFYDGHNMQMLLHVPAVPTNSLLRLLKLHPFPIPIDKNYSMIPMVRDELLAISAGFSRASAHLSSTDLLGCHAVNNVYLCERHGVLQKQLNSSCLGALYLQDFTIVQELCPLHIVPVAETVKQLLDNWFLIFSPAPQTAYISCRNGTQNDAYIKSGISTIHLSPGCKMNLKLHILHADFSINLPSDMVHFQWDWDPKTLFPDASSEIAELLETGNELPTLQDLNELKVLRPKRQWSALKIFITFICSILALAIIALILIYLILINPITHNAIIKLLGKPKPPLIEPLNQPNQENPTDIRLYPMASAPQ